MGALVSLATLLAGCAHDSASATATAPPSAVATLAPSANQSALPAPSAHDAPAATASPEPSGEPAQNGPQILTLSATPTVVRAGQSIAFSARTSTDVDTVTAKVSMYTLPFVRTAPGRFALTFTIPPNVPGFFHGTYSLNVVAAEKGGSSVARSLDVTFQ